jgi:hypothetical protein
MVEIIGHPRRISELGGLCRPRLSAARLQAGFRRSIGGLHRQATDRLIEVRPGLEVVIRVFFQLMGPDPETADALRARRREGPYRFTQNRPRSLVAALQNVTAEEKSKNQLSRDFWCCPIFDFCNGICHSRK